MIYLNKSFSDSIFPMPKDTVPHDDAWYLNWSKFIYSYGIRQSNGIYAFKDTLNNLRLYGAGRQSISPYISRMNPTDPLKSSTAGTVDDTSIKGYMNINESILPIIPKYRNAFIGLMGQIEHDISVDATDEGSELERMQKKERAWFEKTFAKELGLVDEVLGMKKETQEFTPDNREEFEAYWEMHSDKLESEIALQEIIRDGFAQSDDRELNDRLWGDLFDLNMAATMDYVDTDTQRVRERYIDVAKLIIQTDGESRSYKNSTFAGYMDTYTIADLRKETGWDEELIHGLAGTFNNQFGNENLNLNSPASYYLNNSTNYDNMFVPVLRINWKSEESESISVEINADKVRPQEVDRGKIQKKGDKYFKKVKNKSTSHWMVHQCQWIIGTNYIFGSGIMPDQIRSKNNSRLPFHKYELSGQSLCEMSMQPADQMQMAFLKLQNALAAAPNKKLIFDYDTVVATAKELKASPADILTIRNIGNSDMVLKYRTHNPYTFEQKQSPPFIEVEGGIGNFLEEFHKIFESHRLMLEDLTGLSALVTAGNPQSQAVGINQILASATNNVLRPIYNAFCIIKKDTALNMALRGQVLAATNRGKDYGYEAVIGQTGVSILTTLFNKNKTPIDIGIVIQERPSQKERDEIEMMLQKAVMSGRDGKPSITTADYFFIKRMMNLPGGVKKAQQMLAIRENQFFEREIRRANDANTLNNKLAQETEQKKMQFAGALEQMKLQVDIMRKKNETDEAIRLYVVQAIIDEKITAPAEFIRQLTADAMTKQEATPTTPA